MFRFQVHGGNSRSVLPARPLLLDGRSSISTTPGWPEFSFMRRPLVARRRECWRYTRVVENELSLVLAECYPLVNTAKSLQEVFVDAHFYNSADREYSIQMEAGVQVHRSDRTFMLPDEECARL